jgi:hypothetical protein
MTRARFLTISAAYFLTLASEVGLNPTVVLAQSDNWPELPSAPTEGIKNKAIGIWGNSAAVASTGGTFLLYFVNIWRAVINVGALLVIVNFIWGAIDWITAGGDSGKIQKAREKITQSVIGIIVLASTIALFTFIQRFLGISVLNFRNSSGTNPGGGNGGGTASGCNASTEGTVVTDSSNNYGYCTTGGVSLRCVPPGYAGPQYTSHTWNPCGCTSGAPRAGYKFANCQGPLQ